VLQNQCPIPNGIGVNINNIPAIGMAGYQYLMLLASLIETRTQSALNGRLPIFDASAIIKG
jgi:hypothetical protein